MKSSNIQSDVRTDAAESDRDRATDEELQEAFVDEERPDAVGEPAEIVNLLHHDNWYELPKGWFEEFDRKVFGLAQHKHAFLFSGIDTSFRADLVPMAQAALQLLRGIVGPVVFDPNRFFDGAIASFSNEDIPDFYYVPESLVGDSRNWLGNLVTFPANGRPTLQRIDATKALLDMFDVIPPLEPLNERLDACKKLTSALLLDEHHEVLTNGGFEDVYQLVEQLAEEIDADILSDLCRPAVRMLHPVSILDDINAEPYISIAPPTSIQIVSAALQCKARTTGTQPEVPRVLIEVLGASRTSRIDMDCNLSALTGQAVAWIEETASEDCHFLIRRWLQASMELIVRTQVCEPGETAVSWPFDYQDLYRRYVASSEAEPSTQENNEEPDTVPEDFEDAADPDEESFDDEIEQLPTQETKQGLSDSPMAKLEALIGLDGVKGQVRRLVSEGRIQERRRQAGIDVKSPTRHMLFLGNPGTAKTTVARLMADIFNELGVLRQGQLVEVTRDDLVGEYKGHTATRTAAKVEEALGGILFIDEAYALVNGPQDDFGLEAVNTLLPLMENHREDLVVIAAGYHAEMDGFIKSNSGLKSRFPRTIEFLDYTDEELVEILQARAQDEGWVLDAGFIEGFGRLIPRPRTKNFDNGRWVRNQLDEAIEHQAMRLSDNFDATDEQIRTLTESDVPERANRHLHAATPDNGDPLADLDALVGLGSVKSYVRQLGKEMTLAKRLEEMGRAGSAPSRHMLFLGNPGTAKTTVARIVARIFRNLGVLESGHLVEVTRKDLVGEYKGHTATRTAAKVEEALGGVLFIDESYALVNGPQDDFGLEAVDTLLYLMETHRDDLIVIAAGYREEMADFLVSNSGLVSRFPRTIDFEDFSDDELTEILTAMVKSESKHASDDFFAVFRSLVPSPRPKGFGNGRWVRTRFEEACGRLASRIDPATATDEELVALTADDLRPDNG